MLTKARCFGCVAFKTKRFAASFDTSGLPPTGQLLFGLTEKVTKKVRSGAARTVCATRLGWFDAKLTLKRFTQTVKLPLKQRIFSKI